MQDVSTQKDFDFDTRYDRFPIIVSEAVPAPAVTYADTHYEWLPQAIKLDDEVPVVEPPSAGLEAEQAANEQSPQSEPEEESDVMRFPPPPSNIQAFMVSTLEQVEAAIAGKAATVVFRIDRDGRGGTAVSARVKVELPVRAAQHASEG